MSNKKTTGRALKEKRKAEKAKADSKKKALLNKIFSKRNILIIICAAVLIPIVAAIVTKAVIPAVKKSVATSAVSDYENVSYEVTTYKGGYISTELYDILKAAEKENKSAVKNYGAAISVGDYMISVPEMEMAYYDTYNSLYSDATEYNNMVEGETYDFPYYDLPENYQYSEGITWADYILADAGSEIRVMYYLFDKAISEGFVPTDSQLAHIKEYYNSINSYLAEGETTDGALSRIYCNGVTFNLYARRCIMRMYITFYEDYAEYKIMDSVTQDEVNAFFGDDTHTTEDYALSKFKSDYLPKDDEYVISENTNNLNAVPGLADSAISDKMGLNNEEN